MTKKHFKRLAEIIAAKKESMSPQDHTALATEIGKFCAEFNPRFEWQRWMNACHGLPYRK